MHATYQKVNGKWLIRVVGGNPTAGQDITVTRRNGSQVKATILAVVKKLEDNVTLCAQVPTWDNKSKW